MPRVSGPIAAGWAAFALAAVALGGTIGAAALGVAIAAGAAALLWDASSSRTARACILLSTLSALGSGAALAAGLPPAIAAWTAWAGLAGLPWVLLSIAAIVEPAGPATAPSHADRPRDGDDG